MLKERIDGKLYDTDSCIKIASVEKERTDNNRSLEVTPREEHLCVTDEGAYFTFMSTPLCNHEELKPRTDREAREWCKSHNKTEAAQEHFPHMEATVGSDTKDVSTTTLSRLFQKVDQTDDHHSALSRLLDLLEQEIEEEIGPSTATAILDDVRHLHDEIGGNLVDIDDCLGAIERSEHDYFE